MNEASKLNVWSFRNIAQVAIEIIAVLAIITAIQYWRSSDMLETDGTVAIQPVQAVTLEGEARPLFEQGQRNLLYFFAPWCTVCSFSVGSLDNINQQSMQVTAIALDYQSVEEVRAFSESHDMSVDVILGNNAIREQFEILGYPSYYLLDEQQRVVGKHFGYTTSWHIKLQNWITQI